MNWFLIAFAILGIIIGLAPGFVADNVETCTETDLAQKERAKNRIKVWLYLFGLAIYLSLGLMVGLVCYSYDEQIKELKTRIEVLEELMPKTDTTTVNIQNP